MVLAVGMGPLISVGTAMQLKPPRTDAERRIRISERMVGLGIAQGY